ncbi:Hypp7512 [Branchiostoma lanceolatum]|uniref:Hypp7512 protein n=1 Tax=Branchiostoma lanceolatum TaxID=7740 RepID=A0A8J9Z115_BRALA|nr:Hypp7512 [Branchiostoma lanceolatum]
MISVLVIVRGFYNGAKEVQKLQRKRKTRIVGVAELGGSDPSPRQTSSEIWRCAKFSDVDGESPKLRKTSSEPDCLDAVTPFEPFPNKHDFTRLPGEDNTNPNNNRIQTVLDTNGCHNNSCHEHPPGHARVRNVRSAWVDGVGARDRDVGTAVARSIPDNRVMVTR